MQAINPYVHFNGNAEEAFNFYKAVFGGEFNTFMRYKDAPDNKMPESENEKVVHVSLPMGKGNFLMGGDFPSTYGKADIGNNFCISVTPESEEEAKKIFNGLSEGGQVVMPLGKTFWSPLFGMVTDKFSIQWMVNYDGQQS